MNKIFKVIFNTSLGRMVIVSENAKSQGKVKSTQNTKNQPIAFKIKVIKPLIIISSLFLSPYIFAGNIVQGVSCSNNYMPEIRLTYKNGDGYRVSMYYGGGARINSAEIMYNTDNAVSIGSDCSNLNLALSNAVAIGGAVASVSGVAIGTGALANYEYNVAMGSQAKARGENSVALGANSVADRNNTFAVGSTTNLRQITSVAAGTDNTDAVNKLQMDDSVGVVNKRVTTEVGTLDGKIKLNKDAITTLDTRVSNEVSTLDGKIGTNTVAITALDGRVTINESDISNLQQGIGSLAGAVVTYDDPMTKDKITLAGSSGTTLSNLKAGDISSVSSTDAVTGGQLFTTNQNVMTLATQVDGHANQTASILGGGAGFNNGVFTLPNYSIQGKNYSNVGDTFGAVNNELSSIKGSVVDLKNYVDQQNQIVLDQSKDYTNQSGQALNSASKNYVDQSVASSNQQAQQYTDQSIASSNQQTQQYTDQKVAGLHAQIKEDGKFINVTGSSTGLSGNNSGNGSGSAASVIGDNSLALGINASVQGTNSTAIGYGAQVIGDSSISIGDQNQVTGNGSGAFGDPNIVVGNGSYVIGNDNTVKADNTFVLGNNVETEAKNAVVLGHNSASTRDNTVSVGAKDNERQIIHVADATEATDAVNLRQMQAANTETLKTSKDYTDTRISGLESSFTDFSIQTEHRFKEVDKRFDRQGAMSSAMMNMATSTSGLKGLNRVGVGAGFQGSEKAVAVGYQRIVSDNVSLSLGGAFTEDESSGGAGVGFSW